MNIQIEVSPGVARQWLRDHKETRIDDVPLWVLISLGVEAIENGEDK